jgi:hypothetical protein
MDKVRKPYTKPEVKKSKMTPEHELLLEEELEEYFRLHIEQYHPKYNPTGNKEVPNK